MIDPNFPINTYYHERCEDTVDRMPDNFLDAIATDTPYGYDFMGLDWDKAIPPVSTFAKFLRVLKPGGFGLFMSSPRQDCLSHMILNLEQAGFDTAFTSIYWTYSQGWPKAMDLSKQFKKKSGINPDQAKALAGSYAGFQPKPAVEVILVVMKPLSEKSYTDQALANGKGITWLDDCRVPFENNAVDTRRECQNKNRSVYGAYSKPQIVEEIELANGRFPANLIVSDDALNDGIIYKGQQAEVTRLEASNFVDSNSHGDYSGCGNPMKPRGDSGSYSRYFDVDKWWEERIKTLPQHVQEVFPFLIVPKAKKSEKNFGVSILRGNKHVTVKPIKLCSYMVSLVSRPGDLLYDPYAGTGGMPISCEILGRDWIASEMEKESYDTAQERLRPFVAQQKLF